MFHATWNFGGVIWDQIETGLEELEASAQGKLDMISFQEPPRDQEGWDFQAKGPWHFHSFQDPECWRGVGVAYKAADWTMMRKKASPHGVWLRLKRVLQSGLYERETGGGSARLHECPPTNYSSSPLSSGLKIAMGKWASRAPKVRATT